MYLKIRNLRKSLRLVGISLSSSHDPAEAPCGAASLSLRTSFNNLRSETLLQTLFQPPNKDMAEDGDTKSILKSILVELRDIKDHIAQQDGQYAARNRHAPKSSAVSLEVEQVGRIVSSINE